MYESFSHSVGSGSARQPGGFGASYSTGNRNHPAVGLYFTNGFSLPLKHHYYFLIPEAWYLLLLLRSRADRPLN